MATNFLSFFFVDCMPDTRSQSKELEKPIDDIERYLNLKCRIKNFRIKYDLLYPNTQISEPEPVMAERPQNRPLKYYAIPSQAEPHNIIVAPAIYRNDFELKLSLLSSV